MKIEDTGTDTESGGMPKTLGKPLRFFIRQTPTTPTVAHASAQAPWARRLIPTHGGWEAFESEEEGDRWERDNPDKII